MDIYKGVVKGLLIAVVVAAWCGPVSAQTKQEGPCAEDVNKFCQGIQPGEGRIAQCMKQNEAQLSQACKAHHQAMKAEMEKAHAACKGDVEKFCKGIEPGGGRLAQCIQQHEAELSSACKAHHQSKKEELEKIHQACKGDVETLCKDVQPGGGRILRCLKEKESQMSAECKNSLQGARAKRQEQKEKKPQSGQPK